MNLLISEMFYSIQGEGPLMGVPSFFIRTAYCNLHCEWCDSWYTWDHRLVDLKATTFSMTVERVAEDVARHNTIIVTGGEPMLQRVALGQLIGMFPNKTWQIETNGTRPPFGRRAIHVVSPKLRNNGVDSPKRRINLDILWQYADLGSYFKFVIARPEDFKEVDDLCVRLGLNHDRLYLMPEGTTSEALDAKAPWIARECKLRGYRYSDRLHIRLWGDQRGT